jgi:hypothetical protein
VPVLPAQPVWFQRLHEITAELRASAVSHLDRQAVQKLFQVGERRARQIMAGLPGLRAGNAAAVERLALLARLENTASGQRFQWETARRARLSEELEEARRQIAGRRVRIDTGPEVRTGSLRDLGPGITLRPEELRIEFTGAQDLAAKLFRLSQALANDWEAFVAAVELRTST